MRWERRQSTERQRRRRAGSAGSTGGRGEQWVRPRASVLLPPPWPFSPGTPGGGPARLAPRSAGPDHGRGRVDSMEGPETWTLLWAPTVNGGLGAAAPERAAPGALSPGSSHGRVGLCPASVLPPVPARLLPPTLSSRASPGQRPNLRLARGPGSCLSAGSQGGREGTAVP